jgi:fumarate reductase subunit C
MMTGADVTTPSDTAARGQHASTGAHPQSVKAYHPQLPASWWLRNGRYSLYMLREFSVVPITLWLLSLLVQISRLGGGPAQEGSGYYAYTSPLYIVFSIVCLAFALLHSVTWLNLSGVILRVKLGEREVAPRTVTGANFAQWALATLIIGALLIFLGL